MFNFLLFSNCLFLFEVHWALLLPFTSLLVARCHGNDWWKGVAGVRRGGGGSHPAEVDEVTLCRAWKGVFICACLSLRLKHWGIFCTDTSCETCKKCPGSTVCMQSRWLKTSECVCLKGIGLIRAGGKMLLAESPCLSRVWVNVLQDP